MSLSNTYVATVGAGIVTVFSLADMIMYNRKKRQAFYSAQSALYAQTVHEALVNRAAGRPLTEDQELCLQRERFQLEAQQAAEEKAKQGGMIRRFFLGGLKNEDEGETAGEERGDMLVSERPVEKVGRDGKIKGLDSVISESKVLAAIEAKEKGEKQSLSEEKGYHVGDIDKLAVEANERGAEWAGEAEMKIAEKGREFAEISEHFVEESQEEVQRAKGSWSSWLGFSR